MCGGGENGCGTQVDVFKVSGEGGVGHAIELVRYDGASRVARDADQRRKRRSGDEAVRVQPNESTMLYGFGNLSQGRKKASAAGQGDVLMIAGGYSDESTASRTSGTGAGHGGGYSSRWDMFNATTEVWSSGTWPSAVGRQYGVGIGCGGMLLFVSQVFGLECCSPPSPPLFIFLKLGFIFLFLFYY